MIGSGVEPHSEGQPRHSRSQTSDVLSSDVSWVMQWRVAGKILLDRPLNQILVLISQSLVQ